MIRREFLQGVITTVFSSITLTQRPDFNPIWIKNLEDPIWCKHQSLMLELAVNEDNTHCGSGLGGNGQQLLVLMCVEHAFIDSSESLAFYDNTLYWSKDWLLNTKLKDIRFKLNSIFDSAPDLPKEIAFDFHAVSLDEFIAAYDDCIIVYPNLGNLVNACVLMREWANTLNEAKQLVQADEVYIQMKDYDPMIILYSIRRHMTIDRLVKYNLDEHDGFEKIIDAINTLVGH